MSTDQKITTKTLSCHKYDEKALKLYFCGGVMEVKPPKA